MGLSSKFTRALTALGKERKAALEKSSSKVNFRVLKSCGQHIVVNLAIGTKSRRAELTPHAATQHAQDASLVDRAQREWAR